MILKETRLRDEWWQLTPKMRAIVCDVSLWCHKRGHSDVWTDFMRSFDEQRKLFEDKKAQKPYSVHCYGRGADMRPLLNHADNQMLVDWINQRWVYDPKRPEIKTAVFHDGTALHFHFQSVE